ncbi:MAG TPA: uroporphyrinogen decarboxylase family protein [Nitrolancea sp.]|nr:uroporphyrinogen decarboxylase family protein [Nitrolancea sp.]
MAQMSSLERIEAVLTGGAVDFAPVSLWRHFPERDQTAEALADVTLEWQSRFGFDFIKLMPPGDYATIDWGAESSYQGSTGGTRQTTKFPINRIEDWAKIKPVPIDRGRNREVIAAARLVNERLGGEIPVLQTIFSPLTIAMKLSDGKVLNHMRQQPANVHEALAAITEVTRQMTATTLERGAYGIFFATQCATTDLVSIAEYREFGAAYDLQVLAAAGASRFTLVHLHGSNIMFDEMKTYPAHALNWHDRRTTPTLAEGQASSGLTVVGGMHEKDMATMTPQQAADQARDAIDSLSARHVMIAPGCVMPISTPEANVRAVVAAVRG